MFKRVAHVVDVETAGYPDDGPDDVVEVGVTMVEFTETSTSVSKPDSWLVRPVRPITALGKSIHHIVDGDVSGAPPLAAVMQKLVAIVPPADVYVAHNYHTEQRFLPALAEREWICTLKVARHLCPEAKNHKNGFIRYFLGSIDEASAHDRALAHPPHRAGPDSYVTARNLIKLAERMSIDAMVDLTASPPSVMPFGKWSGHKFAEIPTDYLQWMVDPEQSFDPDLTKAVRAEIARRGPQELPLEQPGPATIRRRYQRIDRPGPGVS